MSKSLDTWITSKHHTNDSSRSNFIYAIEWVMSFRDREWVKSESHVWMVPVQGSHRSVTPNMDQSCHIGMSQGTHEWAVCTRYANEPRPCHTYNANNATHYSRVPGDRNWHIETADWNLAGFLTIFRNLLAGIWGSFLRFIETGFRNWLAACRKPALTQKVSLRLKPYWSFTITTHHFSEFHHMMCKMFINNRKS